MRGDGDGHDNVESESLGLSDLVERMVERQSSTIGGDHDTRIGRRTRCIWDTSSEEEEQEETAIARRNLHHDSWLPRPLKAVAFIDDLTGISKYANTDAVSTYTTEKETRVLRAWETERFYNQVAENAARIGMVVNPKKTQLLCVSTTLHSNITSYIVADGEKISSQDALKTVGFHIGNKPGAHAHVAALRKKAERGVGCLGI